MAGQSYRRVEIPVGANIAAFEAAMVRAGVIAKTTGDNIGTHFTSGTDKAATGLHKLSAMGASWGLPFMGSLDKIGTKLDEAHTKTGKFSTAMAEAGKVTLLAGTVGFAGAAAEAVKLGSKFQGTTASIAANAGITVKSAQSIGNAFLGTAGKSIYSGQQIGEAYAQVAGQLRLTEGHALGTSEAMKVMNTAQDLAEGSGQALGTTTSALASVMQAYHLSVGQAAHASDILFNVSKGLAIPLETVATAMERLHGRLGQLAPSMRDVGGLMLDLAHHGVMGQRGIMTVNSALQTLVSTNKNVHTILSTLGVRLFDAQGHFVGLGNVISQLQPKFQQMTQRQQIYAAQVLFGKQASQVMTQVLLEGTSAFQRNADAANKAGTAHHASSVQSKTFGHEVDVLKATVVDLGTKFGLWLIPKLEAVAKALSSGIQWLGRHKAAAEALAGVIAGVLGAAVATFAYTKAAAFVGGIRNMIAAMGLMGTEAKVAAGEVDVALGSTGVGAIMIALGIAATEMGSHWQNVMDNMKSAVNSMVTFADQVLNNLIDSLNSLIRAFNNTIGRITGSIGTIPHVGVGGPFGAMPYGQSDKAPAGTGRAVVGNYNAVKSAASLYGVPANILWGVYGQETTFGHNIHTSTAGAEGAFQFLPKTAKQFHYPMTNTPSDAQFTAQAADAAQYLAQLHKKYGSWNVALEHYSGGGYGLAQVLAQAGGGGGSVGGAGALSGLGNNAIQKLINAASSGKSAKHHVARAIRSLLYANPLPGMTSVGRTDMGVDFSATPGSAVDAIGAGLIDKIIPNWYHGQPLVEERLTQGSNKGRYVYYAEQLKALVHMGQMVAAGQRIGTVAASGTGLELGFGAGGGRTLAQATTGYSEGMQTPAGKEYLAFFKSLQHGIYTTTKGGVTTGGGQNFAIAIAQAVQQFISGLQKAATALIQTYQTLEQSGTVKTLTKALGVSTAGRVTGLLNQSVEGMGTNPAAIEAALAAGKDPSTLDRRLVPILNRASAGSGAERSYESTVAQLRGAGQTGLANALVSAHKGVMATLAQEMYAEQVNKDGELLNLQSTELKDQTQKQQNYYSALLNIAKAQEQQVVDATQSQVQAIRDMSQVIQSQFSAMTQAITDSTTAAANASQAVVQGINDKTQIQVDILGERGLYGLNLIAQKLQVQSDEVKAYWDQQIGIATQNLDAVTATVHGQTAQAQLTVDQTTVNQNQLVTQAQQAEDTINVQQAIKIATAQAKLDAVTAHEDTAVVGPAQMAVDLGATLPKAQQDVLNAILKRATGQAGYAEAAAQGQFDEANFVANRAMQNAQNWFDYIKGQADVAIANSQSTLATVQGNANEAIASAQQALGNTQNQAAQAEAQAQSAVSLEQAKAGVQFAGSGLVIQEVNITALDPNTAGAAFANELGWIARTQIPA